MLILVRHGESVWNQKNLFTGWVDIPLSQRGMEESIEVGKKIAHVAIDRVFTSTLIRAQMTAVLALMQHQSGKIPLFLHEGKEGEWGHIYSPVRRQEMFPVLLHSALNERMYGELQGKNKGEMMKKYGKEQVQRWRRSYDEAPPGGESLAQTADRVIPYFQKEILPCIDRGENVLVVAHGNSLRGIAMVLENLSKEDVAQFEIATGEALFYHREAETWKRICV